jgi:hypothetical protein
MRKVSSPSHFPEGSYIASFSSKNYEEAIKLAGEWAQRNLIEMLSYYEQLDFRKSILVSYKRNDET